jgi:hypothetical protein
MAILVRSNPPASHWYAVDGSPVHEQPTQAGGTRPTTIRDARKLKLLPSVTNVLGVLAKPQLDTWKLNQVALAAVQNPKQAEESDDYWMKRIVETSKDPVIEAADLGSNIHEALELATDGKAFDESLRVYVDPVLAWLSANAVRLTHREIVLVNPREGYAGRCDALYTRTKDDGEVRAGLLDFKTRKTGPGKAVTPYDGQAAQLAAYAAAFYPIDTLDAVECVNIYISTTEPGRIEVVFHDDPVSEYDYFLHAAAIWRHLKKYDPRQQEAA